MNYLSLNASWWRNCKRTIEFKFLVVKWKEATEGFCVIFQITEKWLCNGEFSFVTQSIPYLAAGRFQVLTLESIDAVINQRESGLKAWITKRNYLQLQSRSLPQFCVRLLNCHFKWVGMWSEFVGLNSCMGELNYMKKESWGELRLALTLSLALTLIEETGWKATRKLNSTFAIRP